MSNEKAAWYVIDNNCNLIPEIGKEILKSHPIIGDYWTLIGHIELLPALIASSGLSDGLDSICCSELPDSKGRVKAYVDFLNMIGADGFAKILVEAIEKCVPYNDAIADSEYDRIQDELENSFYDKDKVIEKMGAYFKSLVANTITNEL